MKDIKEITSVRIVPFTLMSSSVSAVLGLLYAIILLIIFGIVGLVVPGVGQYASLLASLGVALIIALPVATFFFSILSSFVMALIYNLLVPRIGGIKLGMDGEEVKSIPVVAVSLMLSMLYTVLTFIVMLVVAPILAVVLEGAALAASTATIAIPELSGMGDASGVGIILAIIMIIGVPIIVFISTFIYAVVVAFLYNLLAPKIGGVRLKMKLASHGFCEIKKIPPLPLALILAVVLAIVNFIFSLPTGAANMASEGVAYGLGYLVGNTVGYLIVTFIIYALTALIYNFLQPKIGGVEIKLE
ncbi:hypothetical protein FGU46_04545 [Methanobacterium sp. CWC-01]|uniref:hypothetical protein n=1 Tax=Methanobacterium aridiramus TaxID=2584467 RepID=UPI00257538C6|nr:hypothetical protein [Methanobacterium sp. CWC-01]WJI09411.1 hypothetical protein FGU46_04545 [Methanobacterium sp. CWC-01]